MRPDSESPGIEPTRNEIDQGVGPVVVEFRAEWCGYCRALAPKLERALADFPAVRHVKVEDGPGQPLGRSFGVKLWPTLVFLMDGHVLAQHARPDAEAIRDGLATITASS